MKSNEYRQRKIFREYIKKQDISSLTDDKEYFKEMLTKGKIDYLDKYPKVLIEHWENMVRLISEELTQRKQASCESD